MATFGRTVRPRAAYLALAVAALCWSGNFVVGRALRGATTPLGLNFWRWLTALVILLPASYAQLYRQRAVLKAHWQLIVALGVTGVTLFHLFVYMALARTTAINALLFLSMSPILIVIGSWWVFRETVTSKQSLGIGTSLVGVVTLITRGDLTTLVSLRFNSGDLLMLVAVPLWAAYSILLKRRPPELSQPVLLTSTVAVGVAIMTPFYFLSPWGRFASPLGMSGIFGILYIAVFASVVAYIFWNKGVADIGPNKAGLFIHLMPVFGSFLSFVFLGERIATFHVAGAVLVFTGIALTTSRHAAVAAPTVVSQGKGLQGFSGEQNAADAE